MQPIDTSYVRSKKTAARNEIIHVGCAGWSIPKSAIASFPAYGSHLQRYSTQFNCVEINSSFYRSHKPETYARWAQSVPEQFRFAVKLPRAITHYARLVGVGKLLDAFLIEVEMLGEKLGCVLVQLPPSLEFDATVVRRFLGMWRRRHAGSVVVEPRHLSWFDVKADQLLKDYCVGRVAADPAITPLAALPGGDPQLAYFRPHGSPKIYYSSYDQAYLKALI